MSENDALLALPIDICVECGRPIHDGGWPTCYPCWHRLNYDTSPILTGGPNSDSGAGGDGGPGGAGGTGVVAPSDTVGE